MNIVLVLIIGLAIYAGVFGSFIARQHKRDVAKTANMSEEEKQAFWKKRCDMLSAGSSYYL